MIEGRVLTAMEGMVTNQYMTTYPLLFTHRHTVQDNATWPGSSCAAERW